MPSILNPFIAFTRGVRGYWRGVSWLRAHPGYLVLLFIPMVIAFLLFGLGFGMILRYADEWFSYWLFPKPEAWWALIFHYMLCALLYICAFVISFLGFILLANIIASPVYEVVSLAVERDFSNEPLPHISFWQTLRLLVEELKKVSFILVVTVLMLLIPGLNILATFLTAFLVGWEFYDYPLARRGWSFRQRWSFVTSDFWTVMGFGMWLMIPFVNLVLAPLAVAGGTILNLEALQRNASEQTRQGH